MRKDKIENYVFLLLISFISLFAIACIAVRGLTDSYIINPGANSSEMYLTGSLIQVNYTESIGQNANYSLDYSSDAGTNWNNLISDISSDASRLPFPQGGTYNLCYDGLPFTAQYDVYLTKICTLTMSGAFGSIPPGWTIGVYDSGMNLLYSADADGLITTGTELNFQLLCANVSTPVMFHKNETYYINGLKLPGGSGGYAFIGTYRYGGGYNNLIGWHINDNHIYNDCYVQADVINASYSWDTTGLNQSFDYLVSVNSHDELSAGNWQQSNNTFYIGCIPSWQCGQYSACGNYRQICELPKDIYSCGLNFTGDLAVWDRNCSINANTASVSYNNFDLRYSGNQFIFMIFVLIWIICLALTFILQNHVFYILAFVFGIVIGLFLFQIFWIASVAILLIQSYIGIRYLPGLIY